MSSSLPHIITYPGILISPIQEQIGMELLNKAESNIKPYIAALTKFIDISEEDSMSILPRHNKFGWFQFPIILNKNFNWDSTNNISLKQKWCKKAKESLLSACLSIDKDFNPNKDYLYIKIDF